MERRLSGRTIGRHGAKIAGDPVLAGSRAPWDGGGRDDEVVRLTLTTVVTQVRIVGAPGVAEIVLRCVCDTEIPDRDGRRGRGFTNLKRLLGYPQASSKTTPTSPTRSFLGTRRSSLRSREPLPMSWVSLSTGSRHSALRSCWLCVLACSGQEPDVSRTEVQRPREVASNSRAAASCGTNQDCSNVGSRSSPWPAHWPRTSRLGAPCHPWRRLLTLAQTSPGAGVSSQVEGRAR